MSLQMILAVRSSRADVLFDSSFCLVRITTGCSVACSGLVPRSVAMTFTEIGVLMGVSVQNNTKERNTNT
jgi:hypothetical protein